MEKFGGRIWGGLKTSDRSAFIRIHFRKGAIKNGFFQWLNNAYGGGQNPAAHIPDGAPAALVRRRCRFSGLVEGVGFRYETQRIASQLGLSGWVQNQSNGSVVVEIEGPANYIEAFLMAVEAVSRFDITDIQAEDLPPTKAETAFRVLL